MPQMYPMEWLNLYIYMLMLFMMFLIKLFYFFNKSLKQKKNLNKTNFLNMKW